MVMNGSQFSPLQHNQAGPGPDPVRDDGGERKQKPNLYIAERSGWMSSRTSFIGFFFF